MKLYDLLRTVTVAPSRPQGRKAEIGAALALCYDEINECGVEIRAAWSHKGTLCIVVERGPAGKLEETRWPQLFQNIRDAWGETSYECTLEASTETHSWWISL